MTHLEKTASVFLSRACLGKVIMSMNVWRMGLKWASPTEVPIAVPCVVSARAAVRDLV